MPLTSDRAKPAVPFAGEYRLIDYAISNLINSDLRQIVVLTQYKSHSLLRHLQRGWSFLRAELNEMVDLMPAQQRVDEEHWYRGTADAVYQNIDIIEAYGPEYMVILAGDHVYKMDYGSMLAAHVESGADVTVGCIDVPLEEATAFLRSRVEALASGVIDVIVSDDGLQHYALVRQLEIQLSDARGHGNGWLLPAGPLREPASRRSDFYVGNGVLPPAGSSALRAKLLSWRVIWLMRSTMSSISCRLVATASCRPLSSSRCELRASARSAVSGWFTSCERPADIWPSTASLLPGAIFSEGTSRVEPACLGS